VLSFCLINRCYPHSPTLFQSARGSSAPGKNQIGLAFHGQVFYNTVYNVGLANGFVVRFRIPLYLSPVPSNQVIPGSAGSPWGSEAALFFPLEAQMGKKLYVGNLAYGVTDGTLTQLFETHGTVQSAQVIMDRDTGRSKGFGFVEMGNDQEAQAAITALNLKEVEGRCLTVNEARPRAEGANRSSGGRGGFGGGRRSY
jgi:cold-inducible RNA-binding protein